MIKMNIIQRVEVEPISQETLEKWVREKIASQNPEVNVTELKFVQRRDPSRVEVEVTATLGSAVHSPVQAEPEVASNPIQSAVEKGGAMAGTAVEDNLFPEASASEEPSVLDSQASDTAIIDEVLGAEPESSGDVAGMFNLPK